MNKHILLIAAVATLSLVEGQETNQSQFNYNVLDEPINEAVLVVGYSHEQPPYVKPFRNGAYGSQLRASDTYTSAAADWSILPLGTVFKIKEFGDTNFVVDDHGADLLGKAAVKIYFAKPADAQKFGNQKKEIQILRTGDFRASYLKLRQKSATEKHSYAMAQKIYNRFAQLEKTRQDAEELRLKQLSNEIVEENSDTELPAYESDPLKLPTGSNPLFPGANLPVPTISGEVPALESDEKEELDPEPETEE